MNFVLRLAIFSYFGEKDGLHVNFVSNMKKVRGSTDARTLLRFDEHIAFDWSISGN